MIISQRCRANLYANDGLLTRIINCLTALPFNIGIVDESHRNEKNIQHLLRDSLHKSVPLNFGLDKTFALYFYHQYNYLS